MKRESGANVADVGRRWSRGRNGARAPRVLIGRSMKRLKFAANSFAFFGGNFQMKNKKMEQRTRVARYSPHGLWIFDYVVQMKITDYRGAVTSGQITVIF